MKTKNALLGMGISLLSVLLSSQTARSNTLSLPPTITITSPTDGSTFTPGGVMSITANATDTIGAYGLEAITVEKYYIANAADAAQADQEAIDNGLPTGPLPIGSITYRFYADLQPGYKILSFYADGTRNQSIKLSTTTSFYNNPVGSISPVPGTTKASIKNNLLALDSYLTLGAVATGNQGILKTEDNGTANNVTTSANSAGVLLNTVADLGIPLATQDGMIAKSGTISAAFIGFPAAATAALTDGTVISNSLEVIDGSVYTTSGAIGPVPSTNRVLIAQITTNGSLHYEFNLLLQNGTGPGEYYVAKNPGPGDVEFPGLMGTLVNTGTNYPPSVTITDPATNSAVHIGESLAITADAADPGDIIKKVEFFVDGVSIGIDSIAPYAATYLTVAGIHSLTAKATDSGGLQGTSQLVSINVTNNIPVVAITAPLFNSTVNQNASVSIVADASTTIDSVEFFVDGISIGSDKTAPYSAIYNATSIGVHFLTAKATNLQGVQKTSATVNIQVIDPNPVNGLENILVEKYYISNAADAAQADVESTDNAIPTGALPAGSVTYRIYADLLPDYELLAVYGDMTRNQSLKFSTSTSFYNNPVGLISPVPGTTKTSLKNNLLALDSYLTLGAVATGNYGIIKAEDNGAANNVTATANTSGVLLNNVRKWVFH